MEKQKLLKTKKLWAGAIVLVALAAGGLAYSLWGDKLLTSTAAAETPSFQTAQVTRGNLTLSASGTGTLVAAREVNLSFTTSGTVTAVNVQVGDKSKEGDVLAELDGDETLQADLLSAQLDLKQAQQDLEDLKNSSAANLASAQLTVAEAEKTVKDAKSALVWKGLSRCDEDDTNSYYDKYLQLKEKLDNYGSYDVNSDQYRTEISPLKLQVDKAYATYAYCTGFSDYEISSSQATLAKAEADLETAQTDYKRLQENDGIDPMTLFKSENKVSQAEVAVEQAQKDVDGFKITAPFDGTVVSVAGQVGDTASTATFITFADLENPKIDFYVDETDIDNVGVGYKAEVVFDSLPEITFSGTVVQLDPALTNSNGSQMLKGQAQIDTSKLTANQSLLIGLNAAVDIIGGEADNALLIPVEALHDQGDGTYSVFVLENGSPRLRIVEIGLMDFTYAEVKSGLQLGDTVTTGIVETNK